MQLLLILAIILICGKSGGQNVLNEVVPVLEQMGDKDLCANLKQAVKSAEEISAYITAVNAFSKARKKPSAENADAYAEPSKTAFPLKPIAAIAPPDIQESLQTHINCV